MTKKITFYKKMKKISCILMCLYTALLFGQTDEVKPLTYSGYGELYYSYDFSNPANHEKPGFIYNHKKHNEVGLNFACLKINYGKNNVRGNLALMVGNYAQYNLSAEPTWAQFVYEANMGVKLSKKSNIWLDAGIMPSHIGFESAISADCRTLTRSLLAENSPYYETGVKLTYTTKKENFTAAFLLLNGWQHVKKPDYLQKPSFGVQLNYKPMGNLVLNYSNFIGTDKADSVAAWRIFHNFYLQYEPLKKLGIIAGFDIGTDKYNATNYGVWYSPVIIVRYILTEKMKLAVRGEYYFDKKQIIITTNTLNGFQVAGISSNIDYNVNDKVQFRIEGKMYTSKDALFRNGEEKNNYSLTTNLTLRL